METTTTTTTPSTLTADDALALIDKAVCAVETAGAAEAKEAAKAIFAVRSSDQPVSLRALVVPGTMFGSPSTVARWASVGLALSLAKKDDFDGFDPARTTAAKAMLACIRNAEQDRKVPTAEVVEAIKAAAKKRNAGTKAIFAAVDALVVAPVTPPAPTGPTAPDTDPEDTDPVITEPTDALLVQLQAVTGPIGKAVALVADGHPVSPEALAAIKALKAEVSALAKVMALVGQGATIPEVAA